ncbi:hypothetical protein CspeluHIS016_0209580 [Cutaneotrichosporon spelunceum]|uniref:Zn(2)-C6 fungal-type domain-containing protein n=1 Tax=Cutaneotrichosporon spelunceum TaxID=1672016 RepID=A0AAD3TSU9_9TREE|nr:hypothetical protein CspeluHIS016_0209580 [Cutaneotrichosporon spelunceum]
MLSNADGGAKRKRVTRACDKCHRNGSKCSRTPGGDRCVRCVELGIPCTFDRPVKRRGPPARRARVEDDEPSASLLPSLLIPQTPGEGTSTWSPSSPPHNASSSFWRYDDLLDRPTVEGLADIYHRTMYPLRPFIHWPTMAANIRAGRYRSNWGVFMVTAAVCAMAAGKLADGGVPGNVPSSLQERAATLAAECYAVAVAAVQRDSDTELPDNVLPLLKARMILGCTCMQRGSRTAALAHYGTFSILSAQVGFHDEATWPRDLDEIERQERRRLFWFAYQADFYTSTTLGLPPKHRESRARVKYPAEADDDDVHDSTVSPRLGHVSFMRGWNVCSDLYRIIEHVFDNLRADSTGEDDENSLTGFLLRSNRIDSHAVRKLLSSLVGDLPPELRHVKPMTGDIDVDRLGFIATNIMITGQTLKMMLALGDGSSVHHRCAIASELLDELSTLPTSYLRASSSTSLQHLAHVGHLLSGVIDGPLPTWTYLQVRNILLVLSEFIAALEVGRTAPWDVANKLREQIKRIDENMIQAEAAALPNLGDSLMPPLDVSTEEAAKALPEPAPDPLEPAPALAFTPVRGRIMPVPNRMISIDAGLGSPAAPVTTAPPAALPPADKVVAVDPLFALQAEPPHDALSALQLGQNNASSSFNPIAFAASQGMFDYTAQPMDDALISEFLRFWPAHGLLGDPVQDASQVSGQGM